MERSGVISKPLVVWLERVESASYEQARTTGLLAAARLSRSMQHERAVTQGETHGGRRHCRDSTVAAPRRPIELMLPAAGNNGYEPASSVTRIVAGWRTVMATLKSSIEADVPISFADREWSEFMWRSLYGSFATGFSDVADASPSAIDADSGTVTFETEGERLVKVSVEVRYTPRPDADRATEIARAQARLERDLQKYRTFLLRRCEQESCRTS